MQRRLRLWALVGVLIIVVGVTIGVLATEGGRTRAFERSVQDRNISDLTARYEAAFVADYQQHYGAVGVNPWIPILRVPANQPMLSVAVKSGCGNFTADIGQVPIPATAASLVGTTSDSPLVIYQPSTDTDWELWRVDRGVNGSWSACWGGKLAHVTGSSGVFPAPYGLSATGITYLDTAITEADVASGKIDHTIAVDLPRCNNTIVAPGNRTDCANDPGQIPEGTMFKLPAGLAMPKGMTPFAQMVFRTLQSYGMVITDQAGAVMVQAENSADWHLAGHTGTDPITASWAGQPQYRALNGIPWSDLQTLNPEPSA